MSEAEPPQGTGEAISPSRGHELRTPLNQIIGYSELLIDEARDRGQGDLVADLEKIRAAGRKMLALLSPIAEASAGMPLPPSVTAGGPSPLPASPSAAGCDSALLLLVDDDATNRDLLSRHLVRQGHTVKAAQSGEAALDLVRTCAFDLVLLDVLMPEMDGYQVLERMKADPGLRHIPVIMISALDQMDSVVRCIELGAEDYLPKPFDPVLLRARIGACLEKKRLRDREVDLFEDLQKSHKRLQQLETLREDLTQMVVHDLRTPLTALLLGLQGVGMGKLSQMQQMMMDASLRGGETLLAMIGDLLDVSKMEDGSLKLAYGSLKATDLVEEAYAQVATLGQMKGISLSRELAPDLPSFPGDREKLRRTLVNLLGNALRFTPSGGTIATWIRRQEVEQCVQFSITDTGPGIRRESFDLIFEKFGQVASRESGQTASTGLGLTFCRMIVQAHGGRIWVESEIGHGSTFSFTIPY